MGRYVNGLLISIGVAAASILGYDATTQDDILAQDAVAFLCILAAVAPVIAVIRMHTRITKAALVETREEAQAVVTAALEEYIRRIEDSIERHGEKTCKHIYERMLEAFAGGQARAVMDRDAMGADFTDTGPFPATRKY
jgi:hypothetical protein